jgi:membrane protease subunit HflC
VDTFARWKIVEPVKFFQTVNNTVIAQGRLDDIIDAAVRNLVTSYPLVESVRKSDRRMDTFEAGITDAAEGKTAGRYNVGVGREKITQLIMEQAQPKLSPFGIELVDVKVKRINYVEAVRNSVYQRMIAERNQIAEKFRSEGKGEAQKILGDKERELKLIESEAYREAQGIKGAADAESTAIFAASFGVDPEFYSFIKTMEIYGKSLDENSSLILSTDSEFMKYLKGRE